MLFSLFALGVPALLAAAVTGMLHGGETSVTARTCAMCRLLLQAPQAAGLARVDLMTGVGKESVLTVLAKPNANLGLIFRDVKRAAQNIGKVV